MRCLTSRSFLSLPALLIFWGLATPASAQVNVEKWLQRPGVKLVAVEFYATWCKPCMAAVPKWKALHDKYRKDGLRLIVVSTRDAGGACASPGWTPDAVVCDDEGFIADRYKANPLPSAFLWDWQGNLLAGHVHIDKIEQKVQQWMLKAPRLDVQAQSVPKGTGISTQDLIAAVRADLNRSDKVVVVATETERAALREILKKSQSAAFNDESACEIGNEMSANSMLKAIITQGPRPKLQLQLLSAERGCLDAVSSVLWNRDKPTTSVSEAVASLLDKLRRPKTQYPWGEDILLAPNAKVDVGVVRGASKRTKGLEVDSGFLFITSDPAGATVFVDGQETGRTPFQDSVSLGDHTVELRTTGLYAPVRRRIAVKEAGIKMHIEMPPRFGILTVQSKPSGAEISINAQPTGARTPHTFPKRRAGTYTIEVRLDLYKSATKQVRLADGKAQSLSLQLAPNFGALSLTSDPSGLQVVLDGKPTHKSTPIRFERLQAGVHSVQVLAGDQRMGLQRPKVNVGELTEVKLKLKNYKGLLVITARQGQEPVQAEVFVDDKPLGTTPLQVRTAPGTLALRVIDSSGIVRARKVNLGPNGKLTVDVDFSGGQGQLGAALTPAAQHLSHTAAPPSNAAAWVVFGLSAATAAVTVGTALVASSKRGEAVLATSAFELTEAMQTDETLRKVTLGSGLIAVALGGLGTLLFDSGPDTVATGAITDSGAWAGISTRW